METRKIQMTGGSSYIVTLPKDWIVSNGLRKNDPVSVTQQGDGSLSIVSSARPVAEQRSKKVIRIDDDIEPEYLFRLLLGAYVAGYGVIEAASSDKLTGTNIDVIERFVQTAIGLEIIEGRDDSVVIKDLADPSEMKICKGLDRMGSLVTNMLVETLSAIQSDDVQQFEAVRSRDREVDRLGWLIARQTNMFHNDSRVARKMGHTQEEVTRCYRLSTIIESIGDHVTVLSDNCMSMIQNGSMTDRMRAEILGLGDRVTKMFSRSLTEFTDTRDANDCIKETMKTAELCRSVNRYAADMKGDVAISVSMIAGGLRMISECSMDISEIAIDSIMAKSVE